MNRFNAIMQMCAALSCLMAACGGCMLLAPRHPQPWGYGYDIGGPKEITAWTLKQTDTGFVEYGLQTLTEIYNAKLVSRQPDAAAEIRGDILTIFDKLLTGWPEHPGNPGDYLDGPAAYTPEDERSRLIYDHVFSAYMAIATSPLFFEQEPDPVKLPRRHAAWVQAKDMTGVHR
jgi:hypothetical protein